MAPVRECNRDCTFFMPWTIIQSQDKQKIQLEIKIRFAFHRVYSIFFGGGIFVKIINVSTLKMYECVQKISVSLYVYVCICTCLSEGRAGSKIKPFDPSCRGNSINKIARAGFTPAPSFSAALMGSLVLNTTPHVRSLVPITHTHSHQGLYSRFILYVLSIRTSTYVYCDILQTHRCD